MREIRFRCWTGEKMDYDYPISTYDANVNSEFYYSFSGQDKNVFMQYIGLKDINGKEIYESDIIKYAKWNCIVKYKNGSFILECINFDNEGDFFYFADMSNNLLEIIGNLFENPELLKV